MAQAGETGPYFSLTHSHGLAIIAVSPEKPIGVDLEYVRPRHALEQIAARFFSAREQATLFALPAVDRLVAFYRCWTRKEAFIKAIGEGLHHPLNQFDVSLASGEPAALLSIRGSADAAKQWSLREVVTESGYIAALAVEGPIHRLICEDPII